MSQVALQDHEGDGGMPGLGRLRANPQRAHCAHSRAAALSRARQASADHREEGRQGMYSVFDILQKQDEVIGCMFLIFYGGYSKTPTFMNLYRKLVYTFR